MVTDWLTKLAAAEPNTMATPEAGEQASFWHGAGVTPLTTPVFASSVEVVMEPSLAEVRP